MKLLSSIHVLFMFALGVVGAIGGLPGPSSDRQDAGGRGWSAIWPRDIEAAELPNRPDLPQEN